MESESLRGETKVKPSVSANLTVPQPVKLVITRYSQQAQVFTEELGNGVKLEIVQVPGGSFDMGAPKRENGSRENERPQHRVTVEPFCMGKYPVTQAQWRAVASFPRVKRKLQSNPSRFEGDNRPVERISWWDAVEFCDRLSARTGKDYRLPSEAEWEYACRAGTRTVYHFGNVITPELVNYRESNRNETTLVGASDIANAFGLYDMHGNIWEWCADQWHKNYQGAPRDGSAWLSEKENSSRVLRGGSWLSLPVLCRSASRLRSNLGFTDYSVGFRVVCSTVRIL